jgi:hypothetical protein
VRIAVALDVSVRRRAVWLAFGPTVTLRWGARATNVLTRGLSRASARSGTLVARSAARGGAHDPCTRRRSTSAGSQGHRTATASTRTWKVQVLRAVAGVLKHTWLACDLDPSVPWCVATAVLAHTRPRHARSVQPSSGQRRSSRRDGGAPINPCTRNHGTTVSPKQFPRTATAMPKNTNGSGIPPSRYGSPAARWLASRHDLEGDASQHRRIITGKRPRGRRE